MTKAPVILFAGAGGWDQTRATVPMLAREWPIALLAPIRAVRSVSARPEAIVIKTDTNLAGEEPSIILLGVDESPEEMPALRWAARQARLQGGRLRIVHAWELGPSEAASLSSEQREQRRKAIVGARTASIEQALRKAAPDVQADVEILEGPAGPILVELARHASLLVLATHDHPGRRRLTADSVSHYCLSYALCPVVTVPGKPPGDDLGFAH